MLFKKKNQVNSYEEIIKKAEKNLKNSRKLSDTLMVQTAGIINANNRMLVR